MDNCQEHGQPKVAKPIKLPDPHVYYPSGSGSGAVGSGVVSEAC
jgi:hypothetical protein